MFIASRKLVMAFSCFSAVCQYYVFHNGCCHLWCFDCVVTVGSRIVTDMNTTLTKVSIKKIVLLLGVRHNARIDVGLLDLL